MNKIVLCLLSFIIASPVFAGQFEDALRTNNNVFLYLSSKNCGYCKKFDPIYTKLNNAYGNKCKFVKVDAGTAYGRQLAVQVGAMYVPYIVMLKSQQKMMTSVAPDCLMDYACMSKEVSTFIK